MGIASSFLLSFTTPYSIVTLIHLHLEEAAGKTKSILPTAGLIKIVSLVSFSPVSRVCQVLHSSKETIAPIPE